MPASLFHGPELQPGFMVIHGNRLESLRDLAVEWLRTHPLGPLEDEVVLVQSNGISQWLKLALAADPPAGAGIAAAMEMPMPARYLWQAYRAVLTQRDGPDAVPQSSPLDKPRLVWRLMRLLPELLNDPIFAPLARFLSDDDDLRKRHQLAERLADLFDQYQVYRADWLAAWAEGRDELIDARGQARPLAEDQCWQPALWRRLRDDIGSDGLAASRAWVHNRFIEACRELTPESPQRGSGKSRPRDLPRRVVVFGISSLPRQTLEALAAVSTVTQVLLFVHNPCRHYWADIIEHKDLLRAARRRQRQRPGMPIDLDDTQLHLHAQPLLAAWGKQGRDYLRLLDEFDDHGGYRALFDAESLRIDLFDSPTEDSDAAPGLLQQLQDDILELRPPQETRERWPAVDPTHDRSLRFHIAHSALREVEILHDQLLAAFDADPSLRPRDVLVMVPDIDTYDAAVQAVFGRLPPEDPRHIPFTLSDRSRRHRQPLLVALESLLHLPEARLTVSDLLDLLEVPALRARFGLDAEALPVLRRWIEGAGIRWGLDAEQRARLDLPDGLAANTWAFGLRRLLLGYAVGPDTRSDAADEPWHGIEPFDDIGGLEAALAGPLVDLIDVLETQWRALSEPADVPGWCQRLRELLAACFRAQDETDLATLSRLETLLEEWQETTEDAGLTETLPLSVVREHWLGQLDEDHLSQRFLAGAVNIATLMPMRAIPFRHVCLLGMNDGEYPRTQRPLDIDLMGRDYRPGDRSRREDDRYLFLEALLSARDSLTISWVGRSIHDNAPCPPSVLLGQLRDHLADGWRLVGHERGDDGGPALLDALTTEHPLQPFSKSYFSEGGTLFTYAHEWRAVHAAQPSPVAADAELPPLALETPLTLARLAAFLRDPVKAFFTTRLGVFLERDAQESPDHEPFALDGLDTWQLQQALVESGRRAVDDGHSPTPAVDATLARLEREGRLAMGGFAERMRESLVEPLDKLFEDYAEKLAAWPHAWETSAAVSLTLATPEGPLAVEDWLDGLRENDAGDRCRLVLMTSSLVSQGKYNWKHWIASWVAHLAGQIALGPMTTVLLSRAGGGTLEPLPAETARVHLEAIACAWRSGMAAPLPLARDTAFIWHEKGGDERALARLFADEETAEETDLKAWKAAQRTFEGDDYNAGERDRDPYLARQWRDLESLARHRVAGRHFTELTNTLYAPLHDRVKTRGDKRGGGSGDKGGKQLAGKPTGEGASA
ncbi:exodeoxyribonuclease V subunit gamma [Salinicola rhizosphaerae]|uniref:RecBCD enzyme subunit RecC n=1 Tax=Salinicola rhizosphaerae TaxID=1443141 RepID=A0ABQ3DTT8_9GAMM|nr:exodeoxyribonuclease V subunit gamma [Salinicola rhizosphaerae]GHB15013.1 RecBCD enzyme subunit RecC [Salinicola rhizosphaerae]